jgi:Glycosyltransferase family 87
VLGLAAAGAAVALTAVAVASLLRLAGLVSFVLGAYLVGFAEVVAVSFILSPAGWLTAGPLALCLAVVAAGASAAWWWGGRPRPMIRRAAVASVLRAAADPPLAVLSGAAATWVAYSAALLLLTPQNEGDVLAYHLPRVLFWRQQEAVGYVSGAVDLRLDVMPPNAEITQLATVLASGGDRFVGLPQLVALAASCVAAAGLTRQLGLGVREALFAGLVFASLPIVIAQASTSLNDLVVCALLASAAYFVLDRRPAGLGLAALAIGLAFGTKFTALFGLPLVVLVALAGRRDGRVKALLALASGALLGSYWYLLNLHRHGAFDGNLADRADQIPEHSLLEIVTTLRRLGLQLLDLAGTRGSDVAVYLVAGLVLLVASIVARSRGRDARPLLYAAPAVAVLPIALEVVGGTAVEVHQFVWSALGRDDVAFAVPTQFEASSLAHSTSSWYGPLGAVVSLGALVPGVVGLRRGRVGRLAVVFAAAPLLSIAGLALAVVWDPHRGRFLMLAVLMATAAWALTYRIRPIAWATAAVGVVAASLTMLHLEGKPSGVELFEHAPPPSVVPDETVWGQSRVAVQSLLRFGDPETEVLAFVDGQVPEEDTVGLAPRANDFLSPYFGRELSRTVRLVRPEAGVGADVEWLVLGPEAQDAACAADWQRVFDSGGWRVDRRVAQSCDGAPS